MKTEEIHKVKLAFAEIHVFKMQALEMVCFFFLLLVHPFNEQQWKAAQSF
jgi:hypothetical protein